MNVLLVSTKYSPGHFSHLKGFYKLFEQLGYNPHLYINERYKFLLNEERESFNHIWFNSNHYDVEIKPDIILFQNVGIENIKIAKFFKEKNKSKIIYIYHEPWDGLNYLKEGIKQFVKASGAHYYSKNMIKISDLILVPSSYALEKYKNHDKKYNDKVVKFPLLFDDELNDNIKIDDKRYFSYIGHAVKGHGFDNFIDFVKNSYNNNFDIKFKIATRTNIDKYIDKTIKNCIDQKFLIVHHGKDLSNKEINSHFSDSYCLWNLYKRSTQSGILPKAFMLGTPVISTNIGSFPEFVVNGKNGYIQNASEYELLYENIQKIKNNIKYFSCNARKTFLDTFYYKSNINKLKKILNENLGL